MVTFNEALTGKKPPGKEPNGRIAGTFKIQKSVDEKRLAFGWASVAATAAGDTVTDYYEDIIEPDELEQAAYNFVQFYREGGEMHERGGCAVLVESVIFTKEKMAAMGIPDGVVPEGWWIGFKVTDDALAPRPERKKIGVANVNDRIQLNFGREYGLKIDSQPGEGTRCTLTLPELYADSLS